MPNDLICCNASNSFWISDLSPITVPLAGKISAFAIGIAASFVHSAVDPKCRTIKFLATDYAGKVPAGFWSLRHVMFGGALFKSLAITSSGTKHFVESLGIRWLPINRLGAIEAG